MHQEKEKENDGNNSQNAEKNKKDEKMLPTVFVPTSLIINPIIKTPKNIYNNKYQKKKQKPFAERTGDWICKKCKNLNFAFRQECNRCQYPKSEGNVEKREEINKTENNQNEMLENNKNNFNYNNGQQFNFRKNRYKFKKYSYNGY